MFNTDNSKVKLINTIFSDVFI